MRVRFFLGLIGFVFMVAAVADRSEANSSDKKRKGGKFIESVENPPPPPPPVDPAAEKLKALNEEYVAKVKGILNKKCLDCHTLNTRYPWYFKIPGVQSWMRSDILEGRKKLNLSNDFPFSGHTEIPLIKKDLEELIEEVESKSMPPMLYRWMHRDSVLDDRDVMIIVDWAKKAKDSL